MRTYYIHFGIRGIHGTEVYKYVSSTQSFTWRYDLAQTGNHKIEVKALGSEAQLYKKSLVIIANGYGH